MINLTVGVDPEQLLSLTNHVTITPGLTPEPAGSTGPNAATDTAPVVTSADLQLTKSAAGPAIAGTPFTWTVQVVNAGPSVSRGSADHPIVVTDTLPDGVTFSSGGGNGWTCRAAATPGQVTCSRPTDLLLDPAGSTFTLTGAVAPDVLGSLTNAVTVTTVTTDNPPLGDTSTATVVINTAADLSILKSHPNSGEFVPGTSFAWTLLVTNNGPSVSRGSVDHPITVTDTLPAGVSLASVSGTGWTCSAVGSTVTCLYGTAAAPSDMALGDAAPITVTVDVAAAQLDPLPNSATVSAGDTVDPVDADNTSADEPVTLTPRADLSVSKSHTGPGSANHGIAGRDLTWTLHTGNQGPSVSRADVDHPITVVDTLPVGTHFVAATPPAGWECAYAPTDADGPFTGGTVTCTRDTDYAVGASDDIPVEVAVDPAQLADLTNQATISPGPTPQTVANAAPDTASDTAPVDTVADLSIAKTADAAAVPGTDFTWTVTLTNAGPSLSRGSADHPIVVTDTLPAGVTFVSGGSADVDCSADGAVVTCHLAADIALNGTAVFTVTGHIAPDVLGDITNHVTITSTPTIDPPAGDAAEHTITVTPSADLSITKTHDEALPVAPGTPVTWTLQGHEQRAVGLPRHRRRADRRHRHLARRHRHAHDQALGASGATGDVSGASGATGDVSGASGATGDVPGWTCTVTGKALRCVLGSATDPSDLAVGPAAPIVITATVDPGQLDTLPNSATVTPGATPDPLADNNTATDSPVVVGPVADLAVTKTHDPQAVKIGNNLAFTIGVHNNGPSDARNVAITDPMPKGITAVSATGTDWACTVTSAQVRCAWTGTTFAPGASSTITVIGHLAPAAYPSTTNRVTVSSSTPDSSSLNNSAADLVRVPALADLSLTKQLVGSLVVGKHATYRLTVRNNGPTEVPGTITVTDTLPTGLVPVSATGGACTLTPHSVVCRITGPLANQRTAVVDVVVQVAPAAYPHVTNAAAVSSDAVDPLDNNNSASTTNDVTPATGLDISKSVVGSGVDADGNLVWGIEVSNAGPNPTNTPTTVIDTLPAGLTYVSADADGWTCSVGSNTVTCTYDDPIVVGRTVAFRITTRVSAPPGTSVVNHVAIAVKDADGSVPQADSGVSVPVPAPSGTLPNTGYPADTNLRWAGLMLLAGLVLVLAGRRRRTN